MNEQELIERMQELAERAGISLESAGEAEIELVPGMAELGLSEPQGRLRKVLGKVLGNRQPVYGGWPLVDGKPDARLYCRPPAGANVSMLPNQGGSMYVKGGTAWQAWCATYCQCDKHLGQRVRADQLADHGNLSRRTQIVEGAET